MAAHPSPARRRLGMGLLYAAVVVGSLLSASLQPGHAELPADTPALLDLAGWMDATAAPPAPQGAPASSAGPP